MANKILIGANATPLVWADTADYAGDGGTRTHQILLAALAAAAARQGAKADIDNGLVTNRFARRYAVTMRIEFDVAPADGGSVDLYWAASLSSIAATANPGGTTGSDAAYTGTAGSTLAESLNQLQFLGSLLVTNDAATVVLQTTFIAELPLQYGMPVVVNNGSQALEGDDIEMSITFTPLEDEVQ